jgi:hypothetical protein
MESRHQNKFSLVSFSSSLCNFIFLAGQMDHYIEQKIVNCEAICYGVAILLQLHQEGKGPACAPLIGLATLA